MNKVKKNAFIKKIIFVLFPIIIFVITYQYISIVKLYENQIIKEKNTIEETVYLNEKNYKTINQIFNNKLEIIMKIFEKEYEKYGNPEEINLNNSTCAFFKKNRHQS